MNTNGKRHQPITKDQERAAYVARELTLTDEMFVLSKGGDLWSITFADGHTKTVNSQELISFGAAHLSK